MSKSIFTLTLITLLIIGTAAVYGLIQLFCVSFLYMLNNPGTVVLSILGIFTISTTYKLLKK